MRYGALLIDPPWDFRTWSPKGMDRSPSYKTLLAGELSAIPVADYAADDSTLFLWAIDSHLKTALALIDEWGFVYKTVAFVWTKPSIGMGYWTRKEAELCLLATRGKPKRVNADVRQVIKAPRRQHSRKPDEIYGRIERLVDGPYIEFFARQCWPGWDQWGDEVTKFKVVEQKCA